MKPRKKTLFRLLGATGALFALIIALQLAASGYVSSEQGKSRIVAFISSNIGAGVDYGEAALSFIPIPRVKVNRGSIAIPGRVEGTFRELTVYPYIFSLLAGRVKIAKLELSAPGLTVALPENLLSETKDKPAASATVEEHVDGLLKALAQVAPGLSVAVENGSLDIRRKEELLFSFREFRGAADLAPGELVIHFGSTSNIWERISVMGRLDPKNLRGDLEVELFDFRPRIPADLFLPRIPLRVGKSHINLHLQAKMDGLSNVEAGLTGSIPSLELSKGKKRVVVSAEKLMAAFRMDEGGVSATLSSLDLSSPPLSMTGQFLADSASSKIRAELTGENVDVDALRIAALALAGDVPLVQDIFRFVKGGTVPRITVESQGKNMDELGKTESFRIEGTLAGGKISIPGPKLDLHDVRGDAVISKGILYGKNCEGRYRGSWGREGTLTVGLEGSDAPLHLDIMVEADLAELPEVLSRLVENERFLQEISLLENVKGQARGRLILGESTDRVAAKVDVSKFTLSTRYRRVPYPIKVTGGHFYYDETEIRARNLRGTVGKSSFSGLTGRLNQEKEPIIEITSWKPVLALGEIYAWLSPLKDLATAFTDFKPREGIVVLSSANLKGPLLIPAEWHFKAEGVMQNVLVDLTLFEAPVTVKSGKIVADKEKLSFTDAQGTLRDASFRASGVINGYMEKVRKADLAFLGELGPEATNWFSDLVNLPDQLRVRPPLSLSQAHLTYERDSAISFKGDFAIKSGTRATLDMHQSPGKLVIENLMIRDEQSRAVHTLNLTDDSLGLTFQGNLTPTTLNRIFVNNPFPNGSFKGDFIADIPLNRPTGSTARGKLEGRDLVFPVKLSKPLFIRTINLEATESEFRLNSGDFTWGDRDISLTGSAVTSGEGVTLDMDLTAERVEWENLKSALKGDEEPEGERDRADKEAGEDWNLPIRGTIRFRTDSFNLEGYTWSPLQADVTFEREGVNVAVKDAVLCGISTPGTLEVSQRGLALDFRPAARDQELGPAYACLLGKEGVITGTFDLGGEVSGGGKIDGLLRSLSGTLELSARKGRIFEGGAVAKIISFLNVTEVYRGVVPSAKEGFDYKSITYKGTLKEGKFMIDEAIIDGTTMQIAGVGHIDYLEKKYDLKVLVSPLKTVDSIVKLIPLVNYIFGGTLVTIPVKVTGDLDNPKVSYMPASAVGSGLLGIVTNTLKAPVKLIDPLIHDQKEEEEKKGK
ncbi:MAG: hypothetical protein GTN70_01245 [Deltaproteobacteria bacterium]|nr:hypothetical protein [Deltaproteobacteria bacterium]NIS76277.1 hypothetical protein [Deltaproteobacteria bacterium]